MHQLGQLQVNVAGNEKKCNDIALITWSSKSQSLQKESFELPKSFCLHR